MTEPRHLRLAWGGATDQGRVRAVNQDAMFADRGLFVVADGMGGHQGGEVAANLAVRAISGAEHDTCEALRMAVETANRVVHDTSISRPELHGMGTTLTAIAVVTDERGPHFGLVNVGDSRIYRQRRGVLHQLTYDHSYVAELMRRGDISADEAANHPYRNMLTRAIGVHADVDVDEWEVEPEAGDRYLLCSDGLTNEVSDPEINAVLNQNAEVSAAARGLVQLANLNGGRDNATVLIIDVKIDEIETDAADSNGEAQASDNDAETDPLDITEGGAPTPPPPVQPQATDTLVQLDDDASSEAASDTITAAQPVIGATIAPSPESSTTIRWLREPISITARALYIPVSVAAAILLVLLAVGWYARSGYHVGSLGDEVVVYKGRAGGVLWFDPTLEDRPGILLIDLMPGDRALVEGGNETESLAGAQAFIDDLRTRITVVDTNAGEPTSTTLPEETGS